MFTAHPRTQAKYRRTFAGDGDKAAMQSPATCALDVGSHRSPYSRRMVGHDSKLFTNPDA